MNLSAALCLVAATGAAAPGVEELSPEARAEYEQKYLEVVDELVVVDGDSSTRRQVYQGKYRKSLSDTEFYRLVGKPEQSDFIQGRHRLQAGLFVGGLVALAVGSIISIKAITDGQCKREVTDPLFAECVRMSAARDRDPAAGMVLFIGGAGLAMSALFLNPRPVAPEEMRRLADEYNRALRGRLTGGPATAEKRSAIRLQALPYAAPGGGGLVLRGAF